MPSSNNNSGNNGVCEKRLLMIEFSIPPLKISDRISSNGSLVGDSTAYPNRLTSGSEDTFGRVDSASKGFL